mmetsp:Transcript_20175/g.41887  ORF Transcript_20175/g.41887 Transcript_20175/m.41887 type:complete len:376 (-) Transcript_20175:763-1890(-)
MVPGARLFVLEQVRLRYYGKRLCGCLVLVLHGHHGLLPERHAAQRDGGTRGLLSVAHHRNLPGPDDLPVRAHRQGFRGVFAAGIFKVPPPHRRHTGGPPAHDGGDRGGQSDQRVVQPPDVPRQALWADSLAAGRRRRGGCLVRPGHHDERAVRFDLVWLRERHHAHVGHLQQPPVVPPPAGRDLSLPPRNLERREHRATVDLSLEGSQGDAGLCRGAPGPGGQVRLLPDLLFDRHDLLRDAHQPHPGGLRQFPGAEAADDRLPQVPAAHGQHEPLPEPHRGRTGGRAHLHHLPGRDDRRDGKAPAGMWAHFSQELPPRMAGSTTDVSNVSWRYFCYGSKAESKRRGGCTDTRAAAATRAGERGNQERRNDRKRKH